ncbi:serine hydrolase domain-containing protein [Novacetimonas hansenii]|uniref:Beta-lactamase family protein n=1 Tax=Novacetimonas hansenii TaxID=436 RepID=A0AAW5ET61_NOVHA|nr:serine hydrolase domain-containing protein [Novacetimonas hansenii]MCJ8354073.1 beta-lactamase family protein [Novacetimonas hansenii]
MTQMQSDAMHARVVRVMDDAIASGRVVGAVVVVAVDGRIVLRHAAGMRDRESAIPMHLDTCFRLASLTKPVVTALALALAERGVLDLGAPVSRYLPFFRPRLPDGGEAEIPLHLLLSHSSGLSYGFQFPRDDNPYARAGVSDGLAEPGLSLHENLRRLAQVRLVFPPGEGWAYSLGLDVMGGVLEQVGNASLPDLVRRHIGDRLGGWTRTGFHAPPDLMLATCYADARPMPVRMPADYRLSRLLPCGGVSEIHFVPDRIRDPASYPSGGAGMVGTAEEFMMFLEAVRRGGDPILSRESAQRFGANAVGNLPMGPLDRGRRFGFGGAIVTDPVMARTPLSPGSFTWGGVYGHQWTVDRARGISIVMLSNTALAGMAGAYPDAVVRAVYGD